MKPRGRRSSKNLLFWCRGYLLYIVAYVWRYFLFRTTFIAITGSVGKTTTKECLAAILGAQFRIAKTLNNQNDSMGVPATVLRVRPWHRFAVVEMGTDRPGLIRRSSRLVRPHIAIVLAVARTHTNVFDNLNDTAAEKAQILDALSPKGLAILNGDDRRVDKMAERCSCKVKKFGTSPGFDLWAGEVSSKWPDRLSLRVATHTEVVPVKTSLVGEHWVNSVLAALLAAQSCGVDLSTAIAELERVKPFTARMQPVQLPSGATVIRDEYNGSPDPLLAAVKFFKECEATRRVLVISDISDSKQKSKIRFREFGKIAAQTADLAIFIGEHGYRGAKAAYAFGMRPDCALSFTELYKATQYLKSELRNGDVVLLRGRTTDHLSRVYFGQLGTIGCWKSKCEKTIVCDLCQELKPEFDLQATLSRL